MAPAEETDTPMEHNETEGTAEVAQDSSFDALEDSKSSRKREREASLEPSANAQDVPTTRSPKKKNRASGSLGATEEEDDINRLTPSPPVSGSPPHESKVRQISQGVIDITWRNKKKPESDADKDIQVDETSKTSASDMVTAPTSSVVWSQNNEGHPPMDVQVTTSDEVPSYSPNDEDNDVVLASASDLSEENCLKRKMADRAVSQGPPESAASPSAVEQPKRARDDPDKDENPRVTKRPSPPPESEAESSKTSIPPTPAATPATFKSGGFAAYSGTSSPFAAVKGTSLFGGNKAASASTPSKKPATTFTTSFASSDSSSSVFTAGKSDGATPAKKSAFGGFESFAGTASPFVSVPRSKSPSSRLGRAGSPSRRSAAPSSTASSSRFSEYSAGGAQGYASPAPPAPKRARAGSPETKSSRSGSAESTKEEKKTSAETKPVKKAGSFGDKLRAQKEDGEQEMSDEEGDKHAFLEQEAVTGEEEDIVLHQVRGKLFYLHDGQWKERGTGSFKLNVRRADRGGARLVMRREAVNTLLLNASLFPGMKATIAQDPRYVRFSVITATGATHYNLRLPTGKAATDLLNGINANIPTN